MVKNVGVWINERKAAIVTIIDDQADMICIDSCDEYPIGSPEEAHYEAQVVTSGVQAEDSTEEELRKYLHRVIKRLRDAKYVFIFGPGETKRALRREILKTGGMAVKIAGTQPADEMPPEQIASRVKRYFLVAN
jgi:hypothetical protein